MIQKMRESLKSLINQMTLKDDATSSDQSISWHAHREAERLDESAFIVELKEFVGTAASKDERKATYFILGSIGQNAADSPCALILTERITAESDKYVLSVLLGALAKVPKLTDLSLEPIYGLLNEKRWLVGNSAIQALRKSQAQASEDHLLALLAETADQYDKVYCQATLADIGTRRSLPFLTQNLSSRKRDVKASAEGAIAAIQARSP